MSSGIPAGFVPDRFRARPGGIHNDDCRSGVRMRLERDTGATSWHWGRKRSGPLTLAWISRAVAGPTAISPAVRGARPATSARGIGEGLSPGAARNENAGEPTPLTGTTWRLMTASVPRLASIAARATPNVRRPRGERIGRRQRGEVPHDTGPLGVRERLVQTMVDGQRTDHAENANHRADQRGAHGNARGALAAVKRLHPTTCLDIIPSPVRQPDERGRHVGRGRAR